MVIEWIQGDAARGKERIWIRGLMYYAAITIFLLWLSPLAVSVILFGCGYHRLQFLLCHLAHVY